MKNIHKIILAERNKRFEDNEQLSLGDLINELEKLLPNVEDDCTINLDFPNSYPNSVTSWRGSYNELSIEYSNIYDNKTTLKEFIKTLKNAIGETFTGWKGGSYIMTKDTPLWVANSGNSGNTGNTAVIGVLPIVGCNGIYDVIINTRYIDY